MDKLNEEEKRFITEYESKEDEEKLEFMATQGLIKGSNKLMSIYAKLGLWKQEK